MKLHLVNNIAQKGDPHMEQHEYFHQIATDVTKQLLVEWQKEPFRWEREIEIQSELFARLTTAFQLIGKSLITHSTGIAARIAAEPCVYYDEPGLPCKPDIVLRDDVEVAPPSGDHWPLIWVCEIKFDPYYKAVGLNPDIEKVRALIEQQKTKFGCCVRLSHRLSAPGDGIRKVDEQNANLCTWEVCKL